MEEKTTPVLGELLGEHKEPILGGKFFISKVSGEGTARFALLHFTSLEQKTINQITDLRKQATWIENFGIAVPNLGTISFYSCEMDGEMLGDSPFKELTPGRYQALSHRFGPYEIESELFEVSTSTFKSSECLYMSAYEKHTTVQNEIDHFTTKDLLNGRG